MEEVGGKLSMFRSRLGRVCFGSGIGVLACTTRQLGSLWAFPLGALQGKPILPVDLR